MNFENLKYFLYYLDHLHDFFLEKGNDILAFGPNLNSGSIGKQALQPDWLMGQMGS
jgi:hypothetical protein